MNPVRRAWLRELGVDYLRTVGPAPASKPVLSALVQAIPEANAKTAVEAPGIDALVRPVIPVATPAIAADADEAWTALQQEVSGCVKCGLCKGRTQTVFGVGSRISSWMIVGEAPGEQEDKQGEPFVGRSGKLLDNMLAAVGRSREKGVFIANVIKCRPPGNRDPLPEEIAHCSPYLMRQVALIRPAAILVLGRFAAQTLLGTDAKIGSLRGRVHHIDVEGRRTPVVVSYHPAYLLRSPAEKAKSWQDLQLAASLQA